METDFGVDFCQKFDDVFRTLLNPTLSIKDDTILERLLELVVKFLNQVEVHHGATQPIAIGDEANFIIKNKSIKHYLSNLHTVQDPANIAFGLKLVGKFAEFGYCSELLGGEDGRNIIQNLKNLPSSEHWQDPVVRNAWCVGTEGMINTQSIVFLLEVCPFALPYKCLDDESMFVMSSAKSFIVKYLCCHIRQEGLTSASKLMLQDIVKDLQKADSSMKRQVSCLEVLREVLQQQPVVQDFLLNGDTGLMDLLLSCLHSEKETIQNLTIDMIGTILDHSSSKTSLKNGCSTTSAVDHEVTVNDDLPSTLRSQPEKLLQMGHVNAALRLSSELLKCCPDDVDLQGVLFLPVYIVLDEVPESLRGIAKYVQGSMTARTSCVKAITKCLHLIHGIYSKGHCESFGKCLVKLLKLSVDEVDHQGRSAVSQFVVGHTRLQKLLLDLIASIYESAGHPEGYTYRELDEKVLAKSILQILNKGSTTDTTITMKSFHCMSALIKRHPGILRAPTEPEMDRVVSDSAPMQGDGPASGGFYTSKNVTGMSGQEAVSMALGELVQRRLCDVQWEVRDSAIEFIASLLDAKHGVNEVTSWLLKNSFHRQMWESVGDSESYVRATALSTLSLMQGNAQLLDALEDLVPQDELLKRLVDICQEDSEGFARRAAVDFISKLYHSRKLGQKLKEQAEEAMVKTMKDFDWEVKMRCLKFWDIFITQELDQQSATSTPLPSYAVSLVSSEENAVTVDNKNENSSLFIRNILRSGCLRALLYAVDDYDPTVCEEACSQLIKINNELRTSFIDLVTPKEVTLGNISKHNERDQNMEEEKSLDKLKDFDKLDSSQSEDSKKKMLQMLSGLDLTSLKQQFSQSTDSYSNNPITLLEDILASVTENEEHFVDCY